MNQSPAYSNVSRSYHLATRAGASVDLDLAVSSSLPFLQRCSYPTPIRSNGLLEHVQHGITDTTYRQSPARPEDSLT